MASPLPYGSRLTSATLWLILLLAASTVVLALPLRPEYPAADRSLRGPCD